MTTESPNAEGEAGGPPARYFLVGALRSGTTVLRLMIGHHTRIGRCDEFEFVLPILVGRDEVPTAEAYAARLRSGADPHGLWCLDHFTLPEGLAFPALADWLLRQLAGSDDRLVGATVHHHYDQLPRLWPQARYIHLLRDPRDVARSCVQMGWAGNAWGAVPIWQAAQAAWHRLRAQVPPERCLELRFEDLVNDPAHELGRVAAFLGLAYEPGMLEIEKDTSYRRPDRTSARSWRTEAPVQEVREMEARLGPALAEAGYPASGHAPLALGAWQRARLGWADRWGRIRFAQRRLGWPLWAALVLSRRLPWGGLRERVQRRSEAVQRRHLR